MKSQKKHVARWSRIRWIAETLRVDMEKVRPLDSIVPNIPRFEVDGKLVFVAMPNDKQVAITSSMEDKLWETKAAFVDPKVCVYSTSLTSVC